MSTTQSSFSPLAILDKARKAVPAVNYALGVAGIAAAAAIVSWLVGKNNSGIILLSSSFVGMILLFVFSKLVVSSSPYIQFAGIFLVWVILLFFATFLLFTTTAFVWTWPCNWAETLGVATKCLDSADTNKTGIEPMYNGYYRSPELGVAVTFPDNILTLDNTARAQRKLMLVDGDGLPVVVIKREALPDQTNVRLARENEDSALTRMNYKVTYRGPEKEENWSNWYVLSGVNYGSEFYYRRWYCDDSVVSIEFVYPKRLNPLVSKLIDRMPQQLIISACGRQ
jgi:hypothetical protein